MPSLLKIWTQHWQNLPQIIPCVNSGKRPRPCFEDWQPFAVANVRKIMLLDFSYNTGQIAKIRQVLRLFSRDNREKRSRVIL